MGEADVCLGFQSCGRVKGPNAAPAGVEWLWICARQVAILEDKLSRVRHSTFLRDMILRNLSLTNKQPEWHSCAHLQAQQTSAPDVQQYRRVMGHLGCALEALMN